MATITTQDLGKTYWCTSEDVRDDFEIEVQNQAPDHERRIKQGTRRVRSWYRDATGQTPPDDPPDMLRDATSLMVASLAHQAFAANIRNSNDDDRTHIFLEDSARDTFEDWKAHAEVDVGDEASGEAGENVTGKSGSIGGDSPIYRGDD